MRGLLHSNMLVLVLMNIGNLFSYLFQFVIARSLSTGDFGVFNALNSLSIILLAPTAVLPVVFSRYTVELAEKGIGEVKTLAVDISKKLIVVAILLLLLGFLLLPWLKAYLHLENDKLLVYMMIYLSLAIITPALLGIMQGLQRFFLFSISRGGSAFFRFLCGGILVYWLGFGVEGALTSMIVASVAIIGIVFWGLRDIFNAPSLSVREGLYLRMGKYALPVLAATSIIMIMGNIDIVLVRHYCSPEDAGYYAIAAILGRIAFFAPGALLVVLFPIAAKASETKSKDHSILWLSIGMTLMLVSIIVFICWFWSEEIINLAFGEKYSAASELLVIVTVAMGLLAVINVIVTYALAHHQFGFLRPLFLGVISVTGGIILFHDTVDMVAEVLLLGIAGTLFMMFLWLMLETFYKSPQK